MRKIYLSLCLLLTLGVSSQDYISPFDFQLYLSGTFGELRDNHFHAGIDVKTNTQEGKKLKAIADGYISRIKVSTWGYGKVLYIAHPQTGHTSVYAHMQRFNKKIENIIKEQQYKNESFEINFYPKKNSILIKQGEIIGLSGNSGGSGGPHLHFEIRDTKTQNPLNPLAFGFKVLDNIEPVLTEIKIYCHKNSSINQRNEDLRIPLTKIQNGKYSINDSKINVNGDISFSISTFDRQNGAPNNKNGVYSIKMYVDEKLIHYFEVDEINFDETRFINSHIDFSEYTDDNIRFNRCFTLPYNRLSNYKVNINKGILNFSDNKLHKIRFEVRDIEDNLSTLEFDIQSEETSPKFYSKNDKMLVEYDEAHKLEIEELTCYLPSYALYKDEYFKAKSTPKNKKTLSKVYHLMDKNIALHKEIAISIKENIPNNLKEKSYIALIRENGNFKYKGKTWKDGYLHAKTTEFGQFTIACDTTSPKIFDYTYNKISENSGIVSVKIYDNESGISFYRGEINGKWILMDYDYKTNLLKYEIDNEKIVKGEQNLKIVVIDKLNNKTVLKKKFIY